MSWILTLILLTSPFLSEARHHPSSAATTVVVGTVYCDACVHQEAPKPNPSIAGAAVAVECKGSSSRPPFRQEVMTNDKGEFRVDLPFSVAERAKTIRGCTATLVRSNDPSCANPTATSSSSLRLKSRNEKEQIYSAGVFSFKPQICNRKLTAGGGGSSPEKFFLPPNPLNPGLLPPNPLLPPPSLIPPVLPTPPPSIIPPVLPTPPSSPSLPLPLPPLIPGLVPSPSPPPPVLPVPLPPLPVPLPVPPVPFLPPGIPGGPPAKVSTKP